MKKILSIDLDYLTENLEEKNGEIFFKDPNKFYIVKKILDKIPLEKRIYLTTHGEIVKYVNEPISIYNFDHHHDVYYQQDVKRLINAVINNPDNFEFEENELLYSLESCWIYYLYKKGLLKEYNCFLNENSEIDLELLQYGFKFYFKYFNTNKPFNLDLYNLDFDECYIIKSPNYTTTEKLDYVFRILDIGDFFNE